MFALFLLFEAAEFMCVNIDRQILANLRTILYKKCNKCDVGTLRHKLIKCKLRLRAFPQKERALEQGFLCHTEN